MSKRTLEEEGLALALASPECFPSSAALIFRRLPLRKPPRSGGLTPNVKSIGRAAYGWREPVTQNPTNLLWLIMLLADDVEGPTLPRADQSVTWDMNVTL